MALSERENFLRNVNMTGPEWIPACVAISGASWNELRGDLEDVLARHPVLFPDFKKGEHDYEKWDFGPGRTANKEFTDSWGCTWLSSIDGIEGIVIGHPLDDWNKLKDYKVPDPMIQADRAHADWEASRKYIEDRKKQGLLTSGDLPHGFLFMRLEYLRGFENLMMDFATDEPNLKVLIDMVNGHNKRMTDEWLSMDVDYMSFGEDLGTQVSSIISPKDFRKWIVPAYKDLIHPVRRRGKPVLLHSDGYTMGLMDDMIDVGINIVNPQDLVNGIDDLAKYVKGRVCIRLDIDRQTIVPFGTRKEIHDLIEEEVKKLGSPKGGLELVAGIYPPTPPENIDALCDAIEEYRTYWWDGRGK